MILPVQSKVMNMINRNHRDSGGEANKYTNCNTVRLPGDEAKRPRFCKSGFWFSKSKVSQGKQCWE